jgi:ABC-type spermidine/putrescine transport system permease subunit II
VSRTRRWSWVNAGLGLWAVLVFAFLFAPIATAVIYSFNQGVLGRQTSTFTGFTTHWYRDAWANGELRHVVGVSFKVAIATSVLATVLGTITGYVLGRPRGRVLPVVLEALVYFLLIVPEIVLAVSMLLFYSKAGIALGLWPLVAGHSPFTIAVVAIIVRSRVVALDSATEDAAADLGAGSWRTFWDVTFPQLRPAMLAGAILAFTFSFDDLVISLFLTTPTVSTLPVFLFGTAKTGVRPDVYAIAAMMLAFTLVVLTASGLVYRWQARRSGASSRLTSVLGASDAASATTAPAV